MNIYSRILILIYIPLLFSCATNTGSGKIELYKTEILNTELAFAMLVREEGLKAGFLAYASDDAVLNRDNKLIKGKSAMEEYFNNIKLEDVVLEWYPDYVYASASGDLGYTYGSYTFEARNSNGELIKDTGIFHTVWKKGVDGRWRFVWD